MNVILYFIYQRVVKVDFKSHFVYPLVFALRATPQHVGKAGGHQILCCQGIVVNYYNWYHSER